MFHDWAAPEIVLTVCKIKFKFLGTVPRMKQECVELKCKVIINTRVIIGLKSSGSRNGWDVIRAERRYRADDIMDCYFPQWQQGSCFFFFFFLNGFPVTRAGWVNFTVFLLPHCLWTKKATKGHYVNPMPDPGLRLRHCWVEDTALL